MAKYIMNMMPTSVEGEAVLLYLEDYWADPNNYWSIGPNSWLGARSGTYTWNCNSRRMSFFGTEEGEQLLMFEGVNYPDDCQNSPYVDTEGGKGSYATPNKAGLPQLLRWYRYTPPPW